MAPLQVTVKHQAFIEIKYILFNKSSSEFYYKKKKKTFRKHTVLHTNAANVFIAKFKTSESARCLCKV